MTGHAGSRAVTGVQLRFQLFERGQPIALPLVAEDVHEPGEAVDRAQVRPVLAGKSSDATGKFSVRVAATAATSIAMERC